MDTPYGACGLRDVEDDLAATERARDRLDSFFAAPRATRGLRGEPEIDQPRQQPGVTAGRDLIARCGPDNRRRLQTILEFEPSFPPTGDHGFLIAPACMVLESELERLVTGPARAIAGDLVAAMQVKRKDQGAAELVRGWADGTVRTTLGTQVTVLLALRRGLEHRIPAVAAFLAARFEPGYAGLLADKRLGICLDEVRRDYRNPACHALEVFDRPRYAQFARRLVARARLVDWYALGADPEGLGPHLGFLHHHLRHTCEAAVEDAVVDLLPRPAPEGDPVERLLGLRTPPGSALAVHLQPLHAQAARAVRSITVTPTGAGLTFHLGDVICFGVQPAAACHVTLIDVGTTGAVAVLWPNAWSRTTLVDGGRPWFVPGVQFPEFQLRLSGAPGLERVVALATPGPPPAWLQPAPEAGFRALSTEEVGRLVDEVEKLPPDGWGAAVCAFRVEA